MLEIDKIYILLKKYIYFTSHDFDKGAGIFEWPGQTTEDVCAVSTIFIQFK